MHMQFSPFAPSAQKGKICLLKLSPQFPSKPTRTGCKEIWHKKIADTRKRPFHAGVRGVLIKAYADLQAVLRLKINKK